MESFLPSEIGRLIYGYLSENNEELADLFLSGSSVMEECRISKNRSRRFSSKVQGLTLVNILDRYSVLCSLIFKQVSSSQCIHQNVLNVLKKVLYTKVREHNEQLANELLAQNFNFAASTASDTTEPKRTADEVAQNFNSTASVTSEGTAPKRTADELELAQNSNFAATVTSDTTEQKQMEVDGSTNMSVLLDSSVNANNILNEIATCSVDNSIIASQDVASVDVSSSSAHNESQNLNKTVEKTVQTEFTNVINLIEDIESSTNSNQSNNVPDKSKEDPPIDLTEPTPIASLPSTSKMPETAPIENHTNIEARKSCSGVNTKAKSNPDAVKNHHCKSKLKNIHSKPVILPNTKASETKQSHDLHTPPEAEKSSRVAPTLCDNLTLNPHFRRDSYITPLKKRRGNVFGHTILHVNNDQANDSLISRVDEFQSSPRTVSINSILPLLPVIETSPEEVASQENQASKTIPNIIRPSNRPDPSKIKLTKNTPPKQGKLRPVRKPKSDSNEAAVKSAPKAASSNDKEMHLVIPNILLNKGISPPVCSRKPDEAPVNAPSKAPSSNEKKIQSSAPNQAKVQPAHKPKSDSNEPASTKPAPKASSSIDREMQPIDPCPASNPSKLPPIHPKSDLNDPAIKFAPKSAPSADKETHSVFPQMHAPENNPHLPRPPPKTDVPWDSKLRDYVGELPECINSKKDPKTPRNKTPRKTPGKTPRKLKRESPTEADQHRKKRPKIDEHTAKKAKKPSRSKSRDHDRSMENQSKENQPANNSEPHSNQLPVAKPQAQVQPPQQSEETPNIKLTSIPPPSKNKPDSGEPSGTEIASNILRAVAENVAQAHPIEAIPLAEEIEGESEDVVTNLTLEPEVVLYEANLHSV